MSPPRIAYLTGEYPRASDTFIQREVAGLRACGHEVLTCSIRRTGGEHLVGPEQRAEQAATFHVLEAAKRPGRLIAAHARWMRSPGRYLSALRLAWRTAPAGLRGHLYNLIYFAEAGVLAAHLADRGVTHLHNHIAKASCTVAMLASALSGLPYSFTIHGPDIFFAPEHWRIDEKARRARFVACISDFARSQLMCFAPQESWPRLHVVHCGVDPARYDGARPAPGQHLLFVGRLAAVKGVPLLLDALAALAPERPELRLTLIGDGPERAALEAQAARLGIAKRCAFLGFRGQAEVAEALREADMLVLPSFAEGVPVVLMEAMAAQVPVVTTRIAGVPELVEDGVHGRLVAPGDGATLQDAIGTLLDDPEARARMGAAGRAKVAESYDAGGEARRLSALIRAYAGGEAPPKRPEPEA
ncbi:glycosyltransferase family 4 protein [Roseivivax sediminis]|uniref:Glycosyltransferase involved in cell wall bisynthesis n=1 Tax=Roseivivax sediminis TaxID=936889 RepID=A0A1I1UMW4_9RHOB|nr:glycosyltransferase family 4 protein [Roseivivax sediminis]SFD71925.1 Glycosyltransferase involved in cell wall bisynthesis [Roseivivax sediminis]